MPARRSRARVVKLPVRRQGSARPRTRDLVEHGRTVVAAEARAIGAVPLDESFAEAVRWILRCRGRVVVTGMGKPGFVAQKISATLASTGTPSLYVHPAEAAHGDLGRIARDDVVIALSNSGETDEILRLLPALKKIGARIVAVTRDHRNALARGADLVLAIGNVEEACPMGLAPTASTAVLLAVGDALAMTVLANRPFDREEYALFHPGGKLGRGLMKVRELMRGAESNPVVREDQPLAAAVAVMTQTPGRPGAMDWFFDEWVRDSGIPKYFVEFDVKPAGERFVVRGKLKQNGGPTETMSLGDQSAAIDAGGVNAACAADDQRGMARPQGVACDVGAYEVGVMLFVHSGKRAGCCVRMGRSAP